MVWLMVNSVDVSKVVTLKQLSLSTPLFVRSFSPARESLGTQAPTTYSTIGQKLQCGCSHAASLIRKQQERSLQQASGIVELCLFVRVGYTKDLLRFTQHLSL